jgi:DNA topoisomerase-1
VIKFDGFLKVYYESSDENEEEEAGLLPPVTTGQVLKADMIQAAERFTQQPSRYTEASLVKKLEELGIGRPSTYAPIISTIQQRGYVTKDDLHGTRREYILLSLAGETIREEKKSETTGYEKAKLVPNDIGMIVNDFLVEHFAEIMNFNFTASVEEQFDEIAEGKLEWVEMIDTFYRPFHAKVESALSRSSKETGVRTIGKHPDTGEPVLVKMGPFGPMAQIGEANENQKPRFASLLKNQRIETITLEDALNLFKLPRILGFFEETEVQVNTGKFGPYVRHASKFYSLKRNVDDPLTIDLARAIELIEEKRKMDKEKVIKKFTEREGMVILNGRWGPYIKDGNKNYKIPRGRTPADLTLEECLAIIEKAGKSSVKTRKKPR